MNLSVPKTIGKIRLVLIQKQLNQHIPYINFKIDNIFTALELITQHCWMASLELKDAYYRVRIYPDSRKYIRFWYNNKIYQYTVYLNELSSCPRNFSKLIKHVLCVLRTWGHVMIIFIDDLFLVATSYEKCCATVLETIQLFFLN